MEDKDIVIISWCLKSICIVPLLYFSYYEINSAIKQTIREYIRDGWNFIDFSLISTYIAACCLYALGTFSNLNLLLNCAVVILAFIKATFFLRIFEGFSFLVPMMIGVFSDLKYFMMFFIFVIALFGILFSILLQETSDTYNGISSVGNFMMVFRTSLGDFDLDKYKD